MIIIFIFKIFNRFFRPSCCFISCFWFNFSHSFVSLKIFTYFKVFFSAPVFILSRVIASSDYWVSMCMCCVCVFSSCILDFFCGYILSRWVAVILFLFIPHCPFLSTAFFSLEILRLLLNCYPHCIPPSWNRFHIGSLGLLANSDTKFAIVSAWVIGCFVSAPDWSAISVSFYHFRLLYKS